MLLRKPHTIIFIIIIEDSRQSWYFEIIREIGFLDFAIHFMPFHFFFVISLLT